MNTPAHALLAVATFARGEKRPYARHALLGAFIPDLPMFGFYLFQKGMIGRPEREIWSDTYFRPDWQLFFDLFNSAPLALLGLLLAGWLAPSVRAPARVFFASVLLHIACDLPLHHDDAHRHFLPLSSLRFESPVSYWDPAHAGALGAGLEVVCVLAASALLFRRYAQAWIRGLLIALSALSVAAYHYIYV